MAAAAYDACIHRTEVCRSRNRASRQAVDHGHTKAIRRGVDGSTTPGQTLFDNAFMFIAAQAQSTP